MTSFPFEFDDEDYGAGPSTTGDTGTVEDEAACDEKQQGQQLATVSLPFDEALIRRAIIAGLNGSPGLVSRFDFHASVALDADDVGKLLAGVLQPGQAKATAEGEGETTITVRQGILSMVPFPRLRVLAEVPSPDHTPPAVDFVDANGDPIVWYGIGRQDTTVCLLVAGLPYGELAHLAGEHEPRIRRGPSRARMPGWWQRIKNATAVNWGHRLFSVKRSVGDFALWGRDLGGAPLAVPETDTIEYKLRVRGCLPAGLLSLCDDGLGSIFL